MQIIRTGRPPRYREAATVGGAIAFGREGDLGLIEPGFLADFVFYRLDSSGLLPLNVPARQLVHGENVAGIDTVVVDGRVVVRGGKLTCIDEDKFYPIAGSFGTQ